jgi:para-aminobenzoate synthetase/4-amino-4-deoxychorismate lyase
MRGVLLEDAKFSATERVLFVDDFIKADQILLCNSLRGAMKAEVISK